MFIVMVTVTTTTTALISTQTTTPKIRFKEETNLIVFFFITFFGYPNVIVVLKKNCIGASIGKPQEVQWSFLCIIFFIK